MQHHVGGERRSNNWQYLPSAMEKDACGYVGLKNLGATCYMNSLTQNLYMHPGFRRGVFACDPLANGGGAVVPEKNVILQLQSFFGHLQESDYVVRLLVPVKNGKATLGLRADWKAANLGVVAFVQDPRSLKVQGVAQAAVH